jgi:hypothetical protein
MRMAAETVSVCFLVWANAAAAAQAPPQATAAEADFFEQRVRPVLTEHCHSCHGPAKQKSGLRLDSRTALLKGGDGGPVVRPGDPENSPLVQAVRYDGPTKMPPKGKLPPAAVEALTAWVKMGAPWPQSGTTGGPSAPDAWKRHWAFQSIQNPPLPHVKDTLWPRTSVDYFLLARLEAKDLTPSAPADRRTLLRRVTFDLTGLPPTPADVAAFEADLSPDAYARVVDRLLASPAYGERWGRHWLDVARYADTKGYVFFQESEYPWSYTYRDYVVRAFNEDLPFDQFLLQQLAADRLPLGADRRPLTALGFLTLGGRFMNNEQDILDDRIDVMTRGLLGLTVSCARCHDHKFDPIPTRDYYSLYGVFASCTEPEVPPLFAEPPRTEAYAKFARELEARERKLAAFVQAKRAELVAGAKKRVAEYLLAAHARRDQPTAEEFMLIADGNDLNPRMLTRWQAYLERTRRSRHPAWVPWHAFAALPEKEFASRAPSVLARLAGSGPDCPVNPLVARAFADKPPRSMADVARRYGDVLYAVESVWQLSIGWATLHGVALPALAESAREELRQVFHGPDSPANLTTNPINDLELLPDRPSQAKLQELRKAVEQWRATGPGAPPRAIVLLDSPTPHEPRVFVRGNPNNLGEPVPRQFLQVLTGPGRRPFRDGSGRLELAQAIIDRQNPLTARVLVNRVWLHHFGQGLVRTPSDFGLRSDPPTHPELLDHLATAFRDGGWSIKQLHRRILLSAAYQQRSDDRPECRGVDPENGLLWRMNRRRLDFEATRDALLAVAGRLDRTLGGPPVKNILAPAATRRTLYGFLDRLNLPGLLRTFDFPNPDATSPQRDTTTVAPQALFLMNNPFVHACARHLLQRPEIAAELTTPTRVAGLYRLLYGRVPTAEEAAFAREFLGAEPTPVAWERYAQALLLINEFVFVD